MMNVAVRRYRMALSLRYLYNRIYHKFLLKFLSEYAMKNNIPCQVSMEERMACGIGACVGCVVEIKEGDGTTYKKVCKDGPVFDCKEVVW